MQQIKSQHVVSRVLLRQWAEQNKVLAVDLRHGVTRPRSPRSEGFVDRFVRLDYSHPVESVWGEVEKRTPGALDLLRAGSIFGSPEAVDTLRSLIALHLVRSLTWQWLYGEGLREAKDGSLGDVFAMLDDPEVLAALHLDRTGLHPAGSGSLMWTREQVAGELENHFGLGGAAFVEMLLTNYERVVELVRSHGMQIAVAGDGEFVVSDMPAVTYDRARGRAGVLNGVPIGRADALFLPVGPGHALSIGGADGYVDVPREFVDLVNLTQITNSMHKVYVRPGSGLDGWVLAERDRLREA